MKKLLILILLMPVFSSAQVFQAMPQRGYGPVKAFWTDSVLIIPTNVTSGTNLSGGREVGKIRYNITDSSLQAYTGYQWLNAQGGGGSGWRITGNSSTAGTDFLGTTNNTSLRFRTNNTAVAVLDSNGRFGVGTNSPLYPLDIYKSLNSDVVLRVKNDNAGIAATTYILLDNGTSIGGMTHTGTGVTPVDYLLANQTTYGGSGAGGVALGAAAGATIKFFQIQTEIARFSSTGIFGVGTTTPDSLITSHLGLHAKRGVRFSGLPTGVGTKAVRIDANGTLSIADTTTAGGSGTVNSGTQYRLAYYAANGTAVSENAAITANRALISDANGVPTHSTTTTTQLQYLNGATGTTGTTTSNIVFSTSPDFTTGITIGSVAVPTISSTNTLTNKRITKRVTTTASSATPTPDSDASDMYTVTALAAGATFGAPTGTPTDGQPLLIRIKDNGTARSLAWNAIYRGSTDIALPTTTVISKTMYCNFIYNSADSKWDMVGLTDGF